MIQSLLSLSSLAAFFLASIAPGAMADDASIETNHFVMFSDIHFNPFGNPSLAHDLESSLPEQWGALYSAKAEKTLPPYGSDANYALMTTSLEAVAEQGAEASFFVYAGDFLVHHFNGRGAKFFNTERQSDKVRQFAVKTTLFVADQIRAALPAKPIIIAVGNNDASCGDYEIEPNGGYLAAISDKVRDMAGRHLVHDDFDETFKAGAYYGLHHPGAEGAHILVLNNLFWSMKYQNACGDAPTQMGDRMVQWLEGKLKKAQSDGKNVMLVYHIPAGIDAFSTMARRADSCEAKIVPFWHPGYVEAFLALQQRYSDVIVNSLSAHIHHDSFRLFGGHESVEKIVPAISPIYGNNPGFQVFDFDEKTAAITDYRTFFLSNLTKVSAETSAVWKLEYQFTKAYQKEQFNAQSVQEIWRTFGTDQTTYENLFRAYNPVSHGKLQVSTMSAYSCAIANITVESFKQCWCDQ